MNKALLAVLVMCGLLALLVVSFAYADSDLSIQSQALVFLEQVAGLNLNEWKIQTFNITTNDLPALGTPHTGIVGIINHKDTNYSLAMTLANGKVWRYSIELLSAKLNDNSTIANVKVSADDCLAVAKSAISNYGSLFGANYGSDFAQMVPTTLQTPNMEIDKDNKALEITFDNTEKHSGYFAIRWYEKVDGNKLGFMSTTLKIAPTGIVVLFSDNLATYKVATTEVNVSKTQAIDAAMPYIEAFAKENNRKIVSVNATFSYIRDYSSDRGNSSLIYPQWQVDAKYENQDNNSYYGYGVFIWADNGKVYAHVPAGVGQPTANNASPNLLYTTAIAVIVISASLGTILQLKRQKKKLKQSS